MARVGVGEFVTTPGLSSCIITLPSNEAIVVQHQHGTTTRRAQLSVEHLRWLGFRREPILRVDLDTADGRSLLVRLIAAESVPARVSTLVRRLVGYVQDCRSVWEVRARCRRLTL